MQEPKTLTAAVLALAIMASWQAQAQDGTGAAPPSAAGEPSAESAPTAPAAPDASSADAASGVEAAAVTAAENLAPEIQDVQVVGPWTQDGRSGVWRTIMMRSADDPEVSRFFVQQIEEAGGAITVAETTEITEMAEIDGAVVGYRADEPSGEQPTGLTLFFEVLLSDAEIAETYELHFMPGAPYMFGPATN